jgi:hypothetical protein
VPAEFVGWLEPKTEAGFMDFFYMVRRNQQPPDEVAWSAFKVPLTVVRAMKESCRVFWGFEVGLAAASLTLAALGLGWELWPHIAQLLPQL